MRIKFTVRRSGVLVAGEFERGISTEGVGYDPDFPGCSAELNHTSIGLEWRTAWSGFTYTLLNPDSENVAVVLYDGAAAGFLRQNLLPEVLFSTADSAEVVSGSVVDTHGKHEYRDARQLVRAYQLLGKFKSFTWEQALDIVEGVGRVYAAAPGKQIFVRVDSLTAGGGLHLEVVLVLKEGRNLKAEVQVFGNEDWSFVVETVQALASLLKER